MRKIYIPETKIWRKTRPRVLENLGMYHDSYNPRIILNFGYYGYNDDNTIILNKDISKIKDKIEMNQLLDHLKIPHPKTYYYPFKKLPDNDNECVLKGRYGEQGRSIRFTRFNEINKDYISPDNYIQHFIPFEREYRIVIDFKRIIGIREKIGMSKCKNSRTCEYETIEQWTTKYKEISKFAKKVFNKFKIDFTGIDIGETNNHYLIIELNSAPTLGLVWSRKLSNDLIALLHEVE